MYVCFPSVHGPTVPYVFFLPTKRWVLTGLHRIFLLVNTESVPPCKVCRHPSSDWGLAESPTATLNSTWDFRHPIRYLIPIPWFPYSPSLVTYRGRRGNDRRTHLLPGENVRVVRSRDPVRSEKLRLFVLKVDKRGWVLHTRTRVGVLPRTGSIGSSGIHSLLHRGPTYFPVYFVMTWL